jgi:hypothetical protein
VGPEGTVSLLGTANVADDLELPGQGRPLRSKGSITASATLRQRGQEQRRRHQRPDTELDLSGLDVFMLAGHSFIYLGELAGWSTVLMGESISAKSNQTAYLVPASYLSVGANPYLYYGDTLSVTVDAARLADNFDAGYKLVTYPLDITADLRSRISF